MDQQHFTTTLTVPQRAEDVFSAINDVPAWWSEDFNGSAQRAGDEFDVRFADMHYSKQKLTEVIPNEKVVWLVTYSDLSFLENKSEWTGTEIRFEISEKDGQTELHFTHVGLIPEAECYQACFKGWSYFLHHSLYPLITTGKGQPHLRADNVVKVDA